MKRTGCDSTSLGKRDGSGVLRYTVGVAPAAASNATATADLNTYGVGLSNGTVEAANSTDGAVYCAFTLKNTGHAPNSSTPNPHPQDLSPYLGYDIYRVSAEVEGEGWKVAVPNALATAKFGEETVVRVAVGKEGGGYARSGAADVTVEVVSELDGGVQKRARCRVGG
jgi:hypothetical protein